MPKLAITGVLFPGWEILDLIGPLSVLLKLASLSNFEDVEIELVGPSETVETTAGVAFRTDRTFGSRRETTAEHITLVPGGLGTLEHAFNKPMLDFLRAQAGTIGSICTGSSILAEAGLLDGKKATSNKALFDLMSTYRSGSVTYEPAARFVRDGRMWTSSGVSAGIDMAFGLAIDLFPLESIDALAAKLGINPLPSGSDPYTEIHRPRWRPFWKAYFMTSLLKYFSNTMFPGITTAPRQSQGKQILASFLIGDTADSLSLSGAAECFACSKAATAVEYVSLDGGDSIAIGDSDASNPTRRRALKIRPSRAIGDVFKPDSQWGNPTLFIVPPHAEVPTNLDSVLASLEQSNATITLCGMNVIEAGRKAIGGLFPPSTAGGSGFRRAGKWILVDGGSLSVVPAVLDELARQAGVGVARGAAVSAEFAPELVPASVELVPKL